MMNDSANWFKLNFNETTPFGPDLTARKLNITGCHFYSNSRWDDAIAGELVLNENECVQIFTSQFDNWDVSFYGKEIEVKRSRFNFAGDVEAKILPTNKIVLEQSFFEEVSFNFNVNERIDISNSQFENCWFCCTANEDANFAIKIHNSFFDMSCQFKSDILKNASSGYFLATHFGGDFWGNAFTPKKAIAIHSCQFRGYPEKGIIFDNCWFWNCTFQGPFTAESFGPSCKGTILLNGEPLTLAGGTISKEQVERFTELMLHVL